MDLTSTELAATLTTISSWLSYQQRYRRVPGVQAAIVVDDEVVLSAAYGHADLDSREALRPDHRVRAASHSKMVTAVGIMQLVEAGRLRLADRLDDHLEWMVGAPLGDRTVAQLLSHRAGVFRDSDDAAHWELAHPFPDASALMAHARSETAQTQGSDVRFKYSNIGYGLVGQVLERVTGTAWGEHVDAAVFEPAGMAHTGPDWHDRLAAPFATAYSGLTWSDRRVPIDQVATHALAPATGVYSTAADLCRLAAALFDGSTRLLSDRAKRAMRATPVDVPEVDDTTYGLGLMVTTVKEDRLLGHAGGWPGSITRTLFDPAQRIAVSVLTTAIDGPAHLLAEGVVTLLLHANRAAASRGRPPPSPITDATEDVLGRYVNLWGVRDVVRVGPDLLVLDATQGDPLSGATWLEPLTVDRFRMVRGPGFGAVGELLRVERDAAGAVRAIRLGGTRMTPFDQTPQPEVTIGLPR